MAVDWAVSWTTELAEAITETVAQQQHWSAKDRDWAAVEHDYVVQRLRDLLVSPQPVRAAELRGPWQLSSAPALVAAVEDGHVSVEAWLKLYIACGLLRVGYAGRGDVDDLRRGARLLHVHSGLTLMGLAERLEVVDGLRPVDTLIWEWFEDPPEGLGSGWAHDAVWPFMDAHIDAVLDYWSVRRDERSVEFDSERLFAAVASFPEIPRRLEELCYDLALGPTKRDQRAAQDFLATHPDAVRRATAALADSNGTVRAVAAGWLGRLGDRDVVPALVTAFATERNETVKGVLLEALVALGEPVEAHFDLTEVDGEAARAMAKGLPASLRWLDAGRLPDVRRSHGAVVPRETMLWLVVGATKAKSSIPTALLEACIAQLRPEEAEAFGDALLALWSAADEESANSTRAASSGAQPAAARGLLAVVAACGGARSVPDAVRYIRTWHGKKAHQSKALVTMLAHHRHHAGAEALVAIAHRFRAPSIELHARSEVSELAQRRGCTADELEDRCVTSAGFDDRGSQHLSYGERSFTARLLPDCSIELIDEHGKVLKALPTPRRGEEETAAVAKRAFAAAKEQLEETVMIQTARLHDAMCVRRSWRGWQWSEDVAGHPVVARLAARLVWVARDPDGAPFAFRLLDDRSLTSADDEPVALGDDATVHIAHDVVLSDDEVAAWQQHLEDYEIQSLFPHLGRGRAELTQEEAAGHTMPGPRVTARFAILERTAGRLGYRRPAFGANYQGFEKEFRALGVRARIVLQEHSVGDAESGVALKQLVVEPTTTSTPLSLGELPPVLLTELKHDLVAMAAQGTPTVGDA